jgi:ankyrin repeat protein
MRALIYNFPFIENHYHVGIYDRGEAVGDDKRRPPGETALILAVQWNAPALARLLLTARASIDIKDKQGNTALMYARSADSGPEAAEIFNALLAAGASLNNVNEFGETPLILAAAKKNNLKAARRKIGPRTADLRQGLVTFNTEESLRTFAQIHAELSAFLQLH